MRKLAFFFLFSVVTGGTTHGMIDGFEELKDYADLIVDDDNATLEDIKILRNITNDQLRTLLKNSPNLQTLDLSVNNSITNTGLACLCYVKELKSLNLRRCEKITERGLRYFEYIQNLQELNLSDNQQITSAGLVYLHYVNHLRSLNLLNCKGISDYWLVTLCNDKTLLPDLKNLCISGSKQWKQKSINSLRAARPSLKILHIK